MHRTVYVMDAIPFDLDNQPRGFGDDKMDTQAAVLCDTILQMLLVTDYVCIVGFYFFNLSHYSA